MLYNAPVYMFCNKFPKQKFEKAVDYIISDVNYGSLCRTDAGKVLLAA